MSSHPGADVPFDDDDDDDVPFDDPVARTRMAWLRTLLVVCMVGVLLWRLAYVDGQGWWSLAWIWPSIVVLAVGLARMHALANGRGAGSRMAPLAWALAGVLALAGVGVILAAA